MSSSPTDAISVIRKKENCDNQRKMRACRKSKLDFGTPSSCVFYAFLNFFSHIPNHAAAITRAAAPIA